MKRILLIALILNLFSCSGWAAYGGWGYKLKIKVNNPTGNARTDYPVRINIPAKIYIDAGRMNSDLRDIRFSDGSGNELPFWIDISEGMQRKLNNMPVYVKLKTLSPGDNYVYLHFDKSKSKNDSPPGGDPTVETLRPPVKQDEPVAPAPEASLTPMMTVETGFFLRVYLPIPQGTVVIGMFQELLGQRVRNG